MPDVHPRSPSLHLFSTFPGGRPGIGLLLLRVAAGSAAAAQGWSYVSASAGPGAGEWAVAVATVASGLLLAIGFLTPASGLIAGCGAMRMAGWAASAGLAGATLDPRAAAIVLVDAAAIALMGPGALSADAYLFGRREIVIPQP